MRSRRSGRGFNFRKRQGGWSWFDVGDLLLKGYGAVTAGQSANSAKNQAATSSAAADRALDAQTNLAFLNEGRAGESYDEYMDTALPAAKQVLEMARKPIDPNVEAATAGADYSLADSVQRGTRARGLQSRGIDPQSGAALEGDRLSLLDSTAGRAAAMTTARRGATDKQISRVGNAVGLFNPLVGQASSFSSQAANGLGSVTATNQNNANAASAVAGAAGSQFGQSLTDIWGAVQDMWKKNAQPVSTTPAVQVEDGSRD